MEVKPNQEYRLRIGFAGDVMIGRLVDELLKDVPSAYIWGNMLPIMKSVDLNVVNLECAVCTSDDKVDKTFNFKTAPKNVRSLIDANIEAVNLANNHVLDFSRQGLLETLDNLDQAGIKHVGAGRNISEASAPVILTKNNIRIGILGMTDNEPGWAADSKRPGTRYISIGDTRPIVGDIQRLRSQVDLLILTVHWGPNMQERPSGDQVAFAHQLIDHGVDIIHGHSAHIFQGIEIYRGKLIIYDAGDFIDDYAVDPYLRNDRSFYFVVEASSRGCRNVGMIPVIISDRQVNPAANPDAAKAMKRMQQLSAEFRTPLSMQGGILVSIVNGGIAKS